MNIAFLNSIEQETYGGMEEWIRLVSSGLVARGHKVTLLGRAGSRYLQRVSHSVPQTNVADLTISGDFDPLLIARIRKLLVAHDIDILCVNFNKDVRLGGIAARLCRRTKVVWSVGINIARNKLSHRLLTPKLVDRVVVPSKSLKDELLQYGFLDNCLVEVIPIGIRDNIKINSGESSRKQLREKYALPQDAVVAVTVGRLVHKKAHEYLIEAAPEIIKRFQNTHFLFLGDGPREAILRKQIESLGLKDRFILAGMLDDIDLELAGSDLMIHPSKEEPFGIAVLEGMRAGLPLAASRVGGIPEVVEENQTAVLFEPCQSGAIAQTVTDLLSDPDRMTRYGDNGRARWREHFSYDRMIDRVENCFSSVLGLAARPDHQTASVQKQEQKLQSA